MLGAWWGLGSPSEQSKGTQHPNKTLGAPPHTVSHQGGKSGVHCHVQPDQPQGPPAYGSSARAPKAALSCWAAGRTLGGGGSGLPCPPSPEGLSHGPCQALNSGRGPIRVKLPSWWPEARGGGPQGTAA